MLKTSINIRRKKSKKFLALVVIRKRRDVLIKDDYYTIQIV